MTHDTYTARVSVLPACDVAVVGGGIAGVFAALAAGQQGRDVLLIEQHGFVGGQGTAGGVHTFCGETRLVNNAWRDMLDRLTKFNGIADYRPNHDGRRFSVEALKYVLQEMLQEAGVRILLHTQLVDVVREGDRASALIIHNKSGLQRVDCGVVIDASGDADVIARGGWPWEKGGPVFLPGEDLKIDESAGCLQLPMSLYFTLVEEDAPVDAFLPDGAPTFKDDADLPMITIHHHNHLIVVKMKVIGHDATDGESLSLAEQDGYRQMMGVIYHLQTKGYQGRTYANFHLAWTAPHIGIREGRRVIAQYRMTATDVMDGRHFPDAIAVGSYHVDYHWPTVVQRAGTGLASQAPPYQIPLRAMRPLGAANVLVPGRGLSGEQMAMSSFRVMGICAQTGFAAGMAAALATENEVALDDVPIKVLQQALRDAGVRLDLAAYNNYLRVRRHADEAISPDDALFAECHASTLVWLPNGDVVASWFGGTAEGEDDVTIWLATRHEGYWTEPREIVRVDGVPTWNPVLFMPDSARLFDVTASESDAQPRLLLYYRVSKKIVDWRSFVIESLDGGQTWSEPQPLPEGILGPIKNKPIALSDGTWLAGSSVETADEWYGQIERSEDEGQTWTAVPLRLPDHPKGIIQPTLWESAPGHVHALFRSRGVGRIVRADSTDGGRTWTTPYLTDLPNNNSGIDVAKLVPAPGDPGYDDGGYAPLVLAYNPVTEGRTPLVLAVSYDNGHTWPDQVTVAEASPEKVEAAARYEGSDRYTLAYFRRYGEYSYPAVIPTAQGVALAFTFDRKHIQYGAYALEDLRRLSHIEVAPGVGLPENTHWLELIASS